MNDHQTDTEVEFKEEGWGAIKYYRDPNTPSLISFIIEHSGGLVKNKRQARNVLLGMVIVFIFLSLFLFFGTGNSGLENPPEELINAPQPIEGVMPR